MAKPTALALDVTIMGREYRVACGEDEREELLAAVQLLDRRMREIRDASKGGSIERVAVMAALNLANELLRDKSGHSHGSAFDSGAAKGRIKNMQDAIARAMGG